MKLRPTSIIEEQSYQGHNTIYFEVGGCLSRVVSYNVEYGLDKLKNFKGSFGLRDVKVDESFVSVSSETWSISIRRDKITDIGMGSWTTIIGTADTEFVIDQSRNPSELIVRTR